MRICWIFSVTLAAAVGFVTSAHAQNPDPVPLKNWSAPLFWQATTADEVRIARERATNAGGLSPQLQTPGTTTSLNMLVAITPCRLVDTRQAWPAPYGGGAWEPLSTTTVNATSTASGNCTLPVAQAYSANITVVMTYGGTLGYMTAYPAGTTRPIVSTLNNVNGLPTMANAAVIPAGTGDYAGQFNIYLASVVSLDVVIDINGYYVSPTALALGAGTAGAPSLTFGFDTTSGLYSSASGTVNVAAGGTNILAVTPTGVGIGTTAAYPLDVEGDINMSGVLRYKSSPMLQVFPLFNGIFPSFSVGLGPGALSGNTGFNNTASGFQAMSLGTSGYANTAHGSSALESNTIGNSNTATGTSALVFNTAGSSNTATGNQALVNNTTGSNNVAIGNKAALSVSGGNSNNIHIGTQGAAGDNGTIRIGGSATLRDPASQTSFFAAGIRGTITGNNDAISVVIDSNGQLGTVSSSIRFKEDVHDMADASSDLMQLRPVTFRYQKPFADGSKPIQYGLIAEEVAEVYPDLVAHSADGQIESVKYQVLDSMLLNELQKEHRQVEEQADTIKKLESRLAALEDALRSASNGK